MNLLEVFDEAIAELGKQHFVSSMLSQAHCQKTDLLELEPERKSARVLPVESKIAETNQKLVDFFAQAKTAKNLDELYLVLQHFTAHNWTLLERASMSSSYTNHALKLIQTENKDKFAMLENLAELCWQNKRTEKQPAMISASSRSSF